MPPRPKFNSIQKIVTYLLTNHSPDDIINFLTIHKYGYNSDRRSHRSTRQCDCTLPFQHWSLQYYRFHSKRIIVPLC